MLKEEGDWIDWIWFSSGHKEVLVVPPRASPITLPSGPGEVWSSCLCLFSYSFDFSVERDGASSRRTIQSLGRLSLASSGLFQHLSASQERRTNAE
ncbi:hypothetical protein AOLI_G00186560 [Acnodon oligacanthus]